MSATEHKFSFTLNTDEDPGRDFVYAPMTRVTVYAPQPGNDMPRKKPLDRHMRDHLDELINRIQTKHIQRKPNPSFTILKDEVARINSKPATAVFRNIHCQVGAQSHASVTVERGGQYCFEIENYKLKLLEYIKRGLKLSAIDCKNYIMRVTVENKDRISEWRLAAMGFKEEQKAYARGEQTMKKTSKVKSMIFASAKIARQIEDETDMIEHIAAVVEKRIETIPAEEGVYGASKKISLLSTVVGAILGAWRLKDRDWVQAIGEVLSGLAVDPPDKGTAVSREFDVPFLTRDIQNEIDAVEKHKKHTEADLKRLRQQKLQLMGEIRSIVSESPIYGAGLHSYFDEGDLADLEDIKQLKVRCGDLVDAIQVVYQSQMGQQHGGNGGTMQVLDLLAGERITKVCGTTTDDRGAVITSLTFYTDFGQEKTFGSKLGEQFEFEMTDGCYLAAIKGFDAYTGGNRTYSSWTGELQVLPAIGFILKM